MLKTLCNPRNLTTTIFLMGVGLLGSVPTAATPPAGHFDHGNSQRNHFLLRAAGDSLGALQDRYDLTLLQQRSDRLALVAAPPGVDMEILRLSLAQDADVTSVETATLASLPRHSQPETALPTPALLQNLQRSGSITGRCLSNTALEGLWAGFTDQWALGLTRLRGAQAASPSCGAGVTVAIIDTGVDPLHPALAGALVPGYDFFSGQSGEASEWRSLPPTSRQATEGSMRASADQSVQQILEGNGSMVMLDSAFGVILDPALTISLEGDALSSYFGHGTMVAGLIRVAAPGASIMPLRVFDGSGSGHIYDIVDAIYYAVDHGADVINMSFSMDASSQELRRALKYAGDHGVITVAAAGNNGESSLVFPAGYSSVVGVASTTEDDQLSEFTNYGAALVDLAAPGDGIVSAFPGDHYAAGWGTSFATPLVAGTVALLVPLFDLDASGNDAQALLSDVYHGSVPLDLGGLVGRGRLDSLAALCQTAGSPCP